MPNLIDKPQLQATAQVAKSYILEQDTANVTTIINALQQGGGSAPAGKQEGIITVTTGNVTIQAGGLGRGEFTFTSNSGQPIFFVGEPWGQNKWGGSIESGSSLQMEDQFTNTTAYFFAPATENFTAAYWFYRVYDD